MNVDELNSKNIVSRFGISPKLKELTCILCVESLWNSSLPRRLLTDHAKSPAHVSELWKSLSAQSWTKEAIGQKLFLETLPEVTKTWWKRSLNKGAICVLEKGAGSVVYPGFQGAFSKYLKWNKPLTLTPPNQSNGKLKTLPINFPANKKSSYSTKPASLLNLFP